MFVDQLVHEMNYVISNRTRYFKLLANIFYMFRDFILYF